MTTRAILAATAAALAVAAPAAAEPGSTVLYPETVPGAGLSGVAGAQHAIVRLAAGRGFVGGAAFRLAKSGVSYSAPGLRFRSLTVRTVQFGQNAVKLRGTGLANGRRVAFTAVGVHNALPGVDVFRVAWNHRAALGGVVTSGSVFIR